MCSKSPCRSTEIGSTLSHLAALGGSSFSCISSVILFTRILDIPDFLLQIAASALRLWSIDKFVWLSDRLLIKDSIRESVFPSPNLAEENFCSFPQMQETASIALSHKALAWDFSSMIHLRNDNKLIVIFCYSCYLRWKGCYSLHSSHCKRIT